MSAQCRITLLTPNKEFRKCYVEYRVLQALSDSCYKLIDIRELRSRQQWTAQEIEDFNSPALIDNLIAQAIHGEWSLRELGIDLTQPRKKKKKQIPIPDSPDLPL